LTRKAREYAERFSFTVTREYLHLLNEIDPNGIYAISIHFLLRYGVELDVQRPSNTRAEES
jgi:hypothetical protein